MKSTTVGPYATEEDLTAVRDEIAAEKLARQKADAALAAMIAGSSPSGVFHVAPSGSDGNEGTEASPFRTVGKGCSKLGPGITCVVHAGDYAEIITNPPGGESWERPARLVAGPGESPILRPPPGSFRALDLYRVQSSWLVFEGLTIAAHNCGNDAIKITYGGSDKKNVAHHIRLSRMDVGHAPIGQGLLVPPESSFIEVLKSKFHHNGGNDLAHGLYIACSDVLVDECELHDNYGHGIQFYSGYGATVHRVRLRRTKIYGNSKGGKVRAGVIMASGDDQAVEDCEIFGNRAGVCIMSHVSRAVLARTIVRDNQYTGVQIDPGCQAATMRDVTCERNNPNWNDAGTGTIYEDTDGPTKHEREETRCGRVPRYEPGAGIIDR